MLICKEWNKQIFTKLLAHEESIHQGLADLERQRALLELEKQKIELEKEQIALEKARLDLQSQRITFVMETASKMVDLINPGTDQQTKGMLIQTLIPNLLQLGEGKGLELLVSPATPQVKDQKLVAEQ